MAEATRASRPGAIRALPEFSRRIEVRRPQLPPAAPRTPQPNVPADAGFQTPPLQRQTSDATGTPADPPLPRLAHNANRLDRDPLPVVPVPAPISSDAEELPQSPVDLAVLASRIRAFNLTLAEIESELSGPGPFRAERLALLIDQVDRLFHGRRLSQLYYDALTPRQKQRVDSFASADLTLNLLDQRLFEAQVTLMDDNPERDQRPRQWEIEQLRSLSERVKSWTFFRTPESAQP